MVSKFCSISGMEIATAKIRTLQVSFGKQNRAEYCLGSLILHSGTVWRIVSVLVKHDGLFKYLGDTFDVDKSGRFYRTMHKDLIQKGWCYVLMKRSLRDITR